jgi:hypothetical protein
MSIDGQRIEAVRFIEANGYRFNLGAAVAAGS